jgi:hypothetical protein
MNNRQRMRVTNGKIRKELIRLGFYDIRMFGHSRWFKDVYGWDGVAKFPNGEKFIVVWIQCKTGYVSDDEKKYYWNFNEKSGEYGLIAEYIEYMVKYADNPKKSYAKYKVKLTPIGFAIPKEEETNE